MIPIGDLPTLAQSARQAVPYYAGQAARRLRAVRKAKPRLRRKPVLRKNGRAAR
ncbi:hypothetical protein [Parasulfitobacter algicola]|uniref:Uncharacterized protein n=1 Tax=Parasulfitobacter algicola TaxID=2614809 RepID=A0ABX2IK49_9RHOB|nr:hypothetical protein [Sulfitobacter algicola]NSX53251.1 hypothetical protein [Sulfitobacter algicola]